jgi:hypothetical protein
MAIWEILRQLSNLMAIWYIFPLFGTLCQEKSGNPGVDNHRRPFLNLLNSSGGE